MNGEKFLVEVINYQFMKKKKKTFLLVIEGPYCEIRGVNYDDVPFFCAVHSGVLLIRITNLKLVDSRERCWSTKNTNTYWRFSSSWPLVYNEVFKTIT